MAINIDEFLTQVDLVKLAESAGANVQKNGKGYHSSCPIHHGDNPGAFSIFADRDGKQHWRCFTRCQEGGDAITFVMRLRNCTFLEAVKELADQFHVALDWSRSEADIAAEADRRKQTDLLGEAAKFFTDQLWSPIGAEGLAYARSRGFSDQTLRLAGWGFSKSNTALFDFICQHGQDLSLATKTGLIRADHCDFTANARGAEASPNGYLIFPHVKSSRVTYFSSRAIAPIDPKDKSRNIPGPRQIYRAEVQGEEDQVIFVEGQSDAETIRQVGYSAWSLCGLGSISKEDLASLRRKKVVYLAPDQDEAGQDVLNKSNSKWVNLAAELGPLTMVMSNPGEGKDFNDWLKANSWKEAKDLRNELGNTIKLARTWLEIRLALAANCPAYEQDERMGEIGKLLSALPETSRSRYIGKVADALSMTRQEVKGLIETSTGRNDGTILSSIRDGKLCFLGKPVGNFQAQITHELMVDDGLNPPTVRYTISGRLASGHGLEAIDVDAEEFDNLKWIPRHWGARPVLFMSRGNYHEVARAIQEISIGDMKRERVYTYTGWANIEGKRAYLTAAGSISPDGMDTTTRIDLGPNNLRLFSLPEPPEGGDLYEASKASLAFLKIGLREITAPIWAAMFAAPLTQIAPLYSVIWVYGPTQSGKSTIVHLALTHFGTGFIEGHQYHAPTDWTSSATSIEGSMFMAKDIPLVIDDFAPQFTSANESRDMHRKAHYVVRSVGNRSSRGRAKADLSERTTRVPRGLVIATAELPLSGESTVGRMLYIPIKRGDIMPIQEEGKSIQTNPLLDEAQNIAQQGAYAKAMAAYVQWLSRNWEWISVQIPSTVRASSQSAREECPTLQSRLPDYFGLLNAAQYLALRFFQDIGAITAYDADIEAKANRAAILKVISQQAETIAQESPVRKFCEAIGVLLEQKKVYFSPATKEVEYFPPEKAFQIGWFSPKDPRQILLDDKVALIYVKEYWRAMDQHFDTMPDALRRQFAQIPGILLETGETQVEATKWAGGKPRRVLVLNKDRVAALYGVLLENETNKIDWEEQK